MANKNAITGTHLRHAMWTRGREKRSAGLRKISYRKIPRLCGAKKKSKSKKERGKRKPFAAAAPGKRQERKPVSTNMERLKCATQKHRNGEGKQREKARAMTYPEKTEGEEVSTKTKRKQAKKAKQGEDSGTGKSGKTKNP